MLEPDTPEKSSRSPSPGKKGSPPRSRLPWPVGQPPSPTRARGTNILSELGAAFAPAEGERPADAAQRAISTVLSTLSRQSSPARSRGGSHAGSPAKQRGARPSPSPDRPS